MIADGVGEDGQATMCRGFVAGISLVPRRWTRCICKGRQCGDLWQERVKADDIALDGAVYGVQSGMQDTWKAGASATGLNRIGPGCETYCL